MATLSDQLREVGPTAAQTALVWLLRVMSVVTMVSGLNYWVQLTGIDNALMPRFDLLPLHWQVPGVILAILLPCAAMGMWMLTSWGIVLWCAAMLLEIAIYGIWSDSYVWRPYLVAGHVVKLLVLAAILAVVLMQRFRARTSDH
ncbi:DUF6163 family protein [Oricola sp.]|uniref:DUF6163 family protein n=1 Tax=Oricola sp. TaxID=1979950 RepID=UPI003BAC3676